MWCQLSLHAFWLIRSYRQKCMKTHVLMNAYSRAQRDSNICCIELRACAQFGLSLSLENPKARLRVRGQGA